MMESDLITKNMVKELINGKVKVNIKGNGLMIK